MGYILVLDYLIPSVFLGGKYGFMKSADFLPLYDHFKQQLVYKYHTYLQ